MLRPAAAAARPAAAATVFSSRSLAAAAAASVRALSLPSTTSSLMPLRARISNPAFYSVRMNSTAAAPVPVEDPDDVLFESNLIARIVKLNRPKKLNALNKSMVDKIIPRLHEWRAAEGANLILLKGMGGRALCAGGDVAALLEVPAGESGGFFATEYMLDYMLATYPKTIVAIMDGITMGGGAGLSMHVPFRIATETTIFAMPETLIGFYPDVGASFFLPRLDGELGTYLAITGERLNGLDAYIAGAATHFVSRSKLPEVEARLVELGRSQELLKTISDPSGVKKFNAVVNHAIDDFQEVIPAGYVYSYGGEVGETIDRCFKHDTLEEVVAALEAEGAENEFAKKTLETMALRCPLSMKVALESVRHGRSLTIAETFKRDMHIALKMMGEPDFKTGVTYRVVQKQNGRAEWAAAPTQAEVREKFFGALDPSMAQYYAAIDEAAKGLAEDYAEYPYANGLPGAEAVRSFVLGESEGSGPFLPTKQEVVEHFMEEYKYKAGVSERVGDILDRKTAVVKGQEEEKLINWV
ncbi:mitochondrial 37S ribosomal protein mS47 [Limtongia smithiae]|uniref:mitochondrial 37S ribosomal protein mS47 n=1 Tax=Limtongia smithiae TaxID=1125753 RepID=UPI0034CF548A